MIYELALVAKSDLTDQESESLKKIVHDVVNEREGEILVEDAWGRVNFAQPTSEGLNSGVFFYFIFSGNNTADKELRRRFGINDKVIKSLILKLGDNDQKDTIVKSYKCPFSSKYKGSALDSIKDQENDNPKKFARRKSCWFKANEIKADWKDPQTFSWLMNEFGKISPARISGISRKHQRFATTAIKQARQIGIASFTSNKLAYQRSN